MKFFSFEENSKSILFITSVGTKRESKKIYEKIMVYPNTNVICFHMTNYYDT